MKKKTLLLLFGVFVSLLLLEVSLRAFRPVDFRIRGNKIVLPTKQEQVFKNSPGSKLDKFIVNRRNSIGFRGEDPPRNFSNHLTLITIGGSTTEGIVLTEGDTWTDYLGDKLEQNFNGVWINNAGLDGHSTFGHIRLMNDYVVNLKPKVAIFLIGINDASVTSPNSYDVNFTARVTEAFTSKLVFLAEHSEVASYVLNFHRSVLADKSGLSHDQVDFASLSVFELDRLASQLLDVEVDYRVLGTATTPGELIDQELQRHSDFLDSFTSRLKALIQLAKSNDIDPVFVTQPAVYGPAIDDMVGLDLSQVILANTNGEWGEGMTGQVKWEVLELYNQVTRNVGREESVLVIDLASKMPKSTKYYYDYIHFTKQGSEKVAQILYEDLCPYFSEKYEDYFFQDCATQ